MVHFITTFSKRLFATRTPVSQKIALNLVIKDPCKFCYGRGVLRCLECAGNKNCMISVTDWDGNFMKTVRCTKCTNGTVICTFCGGSGESHLTF